MLEVLFFKNGNTACFKNGAQVPKLQESWLRLYINFLKANKIDPCKVTYMLPSGHLAKVVKTKDSYSWEIST